MFGVSENTSQPNKYKELSMTDKKNLKTVNQFCEEYPAFTIGSLRNILFYEELNGLKDCGVVKHLGRKILIDCDKFFAWLDTNPSITGR